jgi:hypothetical protein
VSSTIEAGTTSIPRHSLPGAFDVETPSAHERGAAGPSAAALASKQESDALTGREEVALLASAVAREGWHSNAMPLTRIEPTPG